MGIEPITLRRGVAIDSDANVKSGLHRMSLVPKLVRFSHAVNLQIAGSQTVNGYVLI